MQYICNYKNYSNRYKTKGCLFVLIRDNAKHEALNQCDISVVNEPNVCEAFEGTLLELKSPCGTSYIKTLFSKGRMKKLGNRRKAQGDK